MTVRVNGQDRDVAVNTSVGRLMDGLGINPKMMAVQLNERILQRDELGTTVLSEGDILELIRVVGGG